jgi:hypothetical protein
MNSLRPLILITPCIIPRLLWACLRISYPRSYNAIKVPDPNKAHLIFVFKYRLVKTSKKFGCEL